MGLKDCDTCLNLEPDFGNKKIYIFHYVKVARLINIILSFIVKGWIRKGKILQGMQQYSKACTAFQKALELDSNASVWLINGI